MRIGYARVSTEDQDLALQLDALNKAKCKKFYQEKIIGRTKERPEFQKLLDNLRPKDVIIIWKLDRLGRSFKDLVQLVNEIQEKGAGPKSLHDNIDTTTPQGKLTFHIFAALAEFEADMMRERTHAGLKAACAHRGCVVLAVNLNEKRLAIAKQLGADYSISGESGDVQAEVKKIAPEGADVVFECTGIPECIDPAIALCREHGSSVWQGNYGSDPVSMHFLPPRGRRLKMFFPSDDGWPPCRRAVVKNMAMGALKWEQCISHRIGFMDAP